jgi:hypothetical protein
MYKSNKIHKTSSFGTGKRDSFIHQTKTETYNLCRPPFHKPGLDPLYNAPSAPSIGLFSQYSDHLKGREWIEWKKKGLMREC